MKSFVDLFCGGGLGARGAVQAGLEPVLAIDLWEFACKTYKVNFPEAVVINDRIEKIDPLQHCSSGSLDLLIASPECTNHSVAKGSAPRDERSKETALHTLDWISALKPRWVVIENVKEMKLWHRYQSLIESLRNLGYLVDDFVLNSADFGSAQSRSRLFLVAGLGVTPPVITAPEAATPLTVQDILDPDGTWPMKPLFVPNRAKATAARARDAIATLGPDAEFLIVYYGSGGKKSWQTLNSPLRTVTTIDRFALVKKRSNRWHIRMLQPSELARAMSLPSEHQFAAGTRRDKVKICGNGVCSIVMKNVIEQIKIVDHKFQTART
ncbi:DNA cytosine methyltransferase [Stenotrophomonas acidaminiphila]|uniref:DNA cytosine methyltransferase n=1 Tax=Stenotrophomonas acidaminiphila TaxID=128780 RepID=UPI0028A88814|nr:DNA cytosine methyltransferase [Stenotrophomonas acidaminiphila]